MASISLTRRKLVLSAGAAAAALTSWPKSARAAFPERTLRIEVGFAAGGTVDAVARVLAHGMEPILGQSVIIENRPGGSGSIAANAVIAAPADGHMLLFGIFSLAVAPALTKLNYDTTRDLTAVSQVASVPLFMLTTAKSPFRSITDLIAAAKAAPETITYGSGGVGSSAHMAAELFARQAGIRLVHVPYRGSAPAMQGLVAGEVQLLWDTPTSTMQSYIQQGLLRPLAVMSHKRLTTFPNIPAIDEAGLGGDLEVQAWQGVLVRSGTPPDVVSTLNRAVVQAMQQPETRQRIAAIGVEPMATSADAFNGFFKSEVERWTAVARRAGLKAQ
jgi:tripartite-type tricarboxylate transporter receptor subunit TctC